MCDVMHKKHNFWCEHHL